MPTVLKAELVGISDTGKTISVKDSTGLYNAVSNPGGWNGPNTQVGDIELYLISLSHFSLEEVYWQRQVRVATEPNDQTSPGVNQIAGGESINIDSIKLGIADTQNTFSDGVYDINLYAILDDAITVVGNEGETFLVPNVPTDVSEYDVVYVGGVVYDIDKSKPTNNNTVIYLVQELQAAVTSVQLGYKANVKALKDLGLRTCLTNSTGNLGGCGCGNKGREKLLDIAIDQWFSELAYAGGDYKTANDLVISAGMTCRKECGC